MLEEVVHAHASGDETARRAPPAWAWARTAWGASPPSADGSTCSATTIARNAGLALMAAWIAALGGDPVAAERWADAADDV